MKIVDLTITVNDKMTIFPDPAYKNPELSFIIEPEQDWMGRYSGQYRTFNHAGTHIDAPKHFNHPGTIDEAPLEALNGPCIIVGFPGIANRAPVTGEMLKAALPKGVETKGKKLIIWTGYIDKRWYTPNFFEEAPYLTGCCADAILELGFTMVGIDCQTDEYGSKELPVHNKLLGNHVYILEYICNTAGLGNREAFLVAAPLKLQNMEASPCRAYVILED